MPDPTIPTPTTIAELQALLRQHPPAYPWDPVYSIFRIRLTPALAQQLVDLEPDRHVQPWEAQKVANMIRSGEWDADVIPPMHLTDDLKMGIGGTRIRAAVLAGVAIDTRIARTPDGPWLAGGIKFPSGPPLDPPGRR
jgi:hypothetical protein